MVKLHAIEVSTFWRQKESCVLETQSYHNLYFVLLLGLTEPGPPSLGGTKNVGRIILLQNKSQLVLMECYMVIIALILVVHK